MPRSKLSSALHIKSVNCNFGTKFKLPRVFTFFWLEFNTAMSVMVYYILPGVRILNSSRFPMQPGQRFAERQDEQELRGLHLIPRYPRGIVDTVLVCHLNIQGSIPTPAIIFLHGFYQCSSFSLDRNKERENINQWTNHFHFQIEKNSKVCNKNKFAKKNKNLCFYHQLNF